MNGYTCVIPEKEKALRMALLLVQSDMEFDFKAAEGSRFWFGLDMRHEKAANAFFKLVSQDWLWEGVKLKEPA